jgi:hypothetical protein
MKPESLARTIENFLTDTPHAVVVEDGQVVFDLANAKYSLTTEATKTLLHLWSDERNTVRRVLDAEQKNGILRLTVQKFGQAKPTTIEICRDGDRRSPASKKAHRAAYQRLLGRVLQRELPDYKLEKLSSAMDLERSFGPIYTRALVRKGRSAFAALGVNAQESSASIDASLTFGLLWLDTCREREVGRSVIEGLRLFLPPGRSAVVRARMAHLNHAIAKLQLYEVEEHDAIADECDARDAGNIATRLVRCPDELTSRQRFSAAITRIMSIVPETDVAVQSATEVSFRLHGLEFARARIGVSKATFQQEYEITFGAGANETPLNEATEARFAELMQQVRESRRANAPKHDALYRLQPERWLESLIARDVHAFDSQLDGDCVYSQVPAFAASDRAMIDVLARTREGRLAVLELKADEDIHLPLQGLDYWARVKWHHQRGEFQQFGYFPGKQLSPDPPLLMLVAPALRIHPATDTLLRYLSPQIEWTLVGVDENWRDGARIVFRKRNAKAYHG